MAATNNTVADKYVLLRRLAVGGMAEVYLARQMGLDGFEKLVVLKRVLPSLAEQEDFLEMFLDEARTAADLRHPNVVNIFEIGRDQGTYYMVMEYLSGQNMRQVQRYYEESGGAMPLGHCLQVMLGAAAGLHYAHTKTDLRGQPLGIVHRDISPPNVVVTYDGAVKIVDFGIAKAASVTTETEPGIVKGKFEYMSPEQADGQELDARSDQFSLGILLWEMTTGERLFLRATDFVTLRSVADCEVRPPSEFVPDYPPELERIVMRALSKQPDDRYPTCADLAADIEEFLTDARIPHSSARLSRYLRELFAEEAREDAALPLSEVALTDSRSSLLDDSELPDFDSELPATAVTAMGRKAPTGNTQPKARRPPSAPASEDQSLRFLDESEEIPAKAAPEDENAALFAALQDVLPEASAKTRTQTRPSSNDSSQGEGEDEDIDPWLGDTGNFMVALGDYLLNVQQAPRKRTNLAAGADTFIGRQSDLRNVHKLFEHGERLVTIVGPGGAGKTRLARQFGQVTFERDEQQRLAGGVWFCDLTEATTDAGICRAIGAEMEIPLTAGRTDAETIELVGRHLANAGASLMILDNFDQIVELAPDTLSRWMAQAPHTQFLVTSRELLKIPGEVVYELKPLPVPDDPADAETSEAVQLFVQRARATNPDYRLNSRSAPIVGQIVARLDGIPLAIELAAGRIGLLSEQELLERIGESLDVLAGGQRGVHARQATLRNTIDWSWNLLTPAEQSALAQCSVFRGGFTVEAAEQVLALDSDELTGLDAISHLQQKSLIHGYEAQGRKRLALYMSIREYAAEKLEVLGQTEATHGRHASYYLRMAQQWTVGLYDRDGGSNRIELKLEEENLMQVADRSLARRPLTPPVARRAVEAVLALDNILATQGPYSTHVELLDSAVNATAIPGVSAILRAKVLTARGMARRATGDHTDALADLAEAVSIARRKNEPAVEAHALVFLANLFEEKGRHAKAQQHFERALNLARELEDPRIESNALRLLGVLHLELGQLSDSARCLERAIELAQEVGDQRLVGMALGNIAGLYRELRQLDRAQETYERALSVFMDIADRRRQGLYIGYVGFLHHEQGRYESALAHYAQAVKMAREAGDQRAEAFFLAFLGATEAALGRVGEAHASLTTSTQQLQRLGDNGRVAVAMLLHGYLDLARARDMRDAGDSRKADAYLRAAAQRIEAARDTGPSERFAPADRSDEIRMAIRMLQSSLEA